MSERKQKKNPIFIFKSVRVTLGAIGSRGPLRDLPAEGRPMSAKGRLRP